MKFSLLYISCIVFMVSCSSEYVNSEFVDLVDKEKIAKIDLNTTEIQVGESIAVVFENNRIQSGDTIYLHIKNRFGSYLKTMVSERGQVSYNIDKVITQESGSYIVNVIKDAKVIGTGVFKVIPNSPIGKMESFHGPKSLFIDDEDESMLIAIPRDEFGNSSHGDIEFRSSKNRIGLPGDIKPTRNLVSYTTFPSLEDKGKQILSASRDNAAIREQQLITKSGIPVNIEIKLNEYFPFADGRQYFQLSSEPIVDAHGELVEDGTLINYLVQDKADNSLLGQYKCFTINGIATVYIQNPKIEKTIVVFACQYSSVKSNEIEIYFEKSVREFTITQKGNDFVTSIILGNLGQLISDGTIAQVRILSSGETFEFETINGKLAFSIPEIYFGMKEDVIEINIGGITVSKKINF